MRADQPNDGRHGFLKFLCEHISREQEYSFRTKSLIFTVCQGQKWYGESDFIYHKTRLIAYRRDRNDAADFPHPCTTCQRCKVCHFRHSDFCDSCYCSECDAHNPTPKKDAKASSPSLFSPAQSGDRPPTRTSTHNKEKLSDV